jgi:NAD(P)-dependent dehydrogenase (short-subunit alcohol dehydrogenase family)
MSQETIALITGANKGIGYQTARLLGDAGTTVLVGARSEERGTEAVRNLQEQGVPAHFLHLDVTDQADIDAAAKWIDATYGRLDILINNAGITHPADNQGPSSTPLPVLREIFETNVFAVVAVTNAMLPLLRRSRAGRIVNVASELGSLAVVSDPATPWYQFNMLAYNAGKSAVSAVTVAYAKELADSAIKVNAGNPGHCATDMTGNAGFRSPAEGAVELVRLATLDADGPTGGVFRDGAPMPW